MTTNVADDEAARLAALIGDSDSADSADEAAEPPPRDAGRAPTPEPETDGEERAPSAFLFGELCRVRERAAKSEVEAQALERKLSMAEELRSVDVARARAASSRALAEALAALRRRAARDGGDDGADADAAAERDEAQTWDRRAEGWAYERNQRLARLEAACDEARRAWRGEPYRNGDGVARRVVAAVEACLAHRAAAGYAAFLLEAGAATAVAAARAKDGQAARGAREAAMRAVARAQDARLGRWLGRVGWGRGRLALIELLNGGALAASLAALAVEEEPQLKPAEHAVAHYGAGALFADPRCAKRACAALAALEAAGVEFRLRHARAALERLDAAGAPPAAAAPEPGDEDDDDADSVASGPSRVADLGAGSVRSVRTRRTSSPRTVPDVPEDPWPSPRLDPASRRFSAAAFLRFKSYSHRGPRRAAPRGRAVRRHARARRSFAASAFQLRGVIARLLPCLRGDTLSSASSLHVALGCPGATGSRRAERPRDDAIDATAKRRRGRALAALRRGAPGPRPVAASGRRGRRRRPRAAPRRRGRARRRLAVAVEVAAARLYCAGVLSFPRRRSWPIQRASLWACLRRCQYAIAATHRQDAIAATRTYAQGRSRPAPAPCRPRPRSGPVWKSTSDAIDATPIQPARKTGISTKVWSAPDHVAGADRDLGPVRESWAVVRGDADVALVCRLAPQRRPLVRARSARFRVAALDATRFHARGLAAAAASASDAGWRVVDGGRDDAASHAAAKQLANASAFLDVERAVERVFGSSSASAASAEEGPGWFVF